MSGDPKDMIAKGYDEISLEYLERFGTSAVRDLWLDRFLGLLPRQEAVSVLDLGCGAGVPVASRLSKLGFSVTGIDSSSGQIELAQRNVPEARFLCADMTETDLADEVFDGVCAFYSISHIPARQQADFIRRIANWLKPGGIFVASFGTGLAGDWVGDWLGTEMFFSHNDEETTLSSVMAAGFELRLAERMVQDNEDATFLWILARKP